MKKAVILFNLGGPDKLESVEPFLFNLFNDPAIISIPSIFRYPLAKLISKRIKIYSMADFKIDCEKFSKNKITEKIADIYEKN